jgi:hypothetical protein
VKAASGFDGVLASERIRDKKGFVRLGDGGDLGRLAHHLLVQRGAAGGVEHHNVIAAHLGGGHGAAGDVGG